MNDGPQNGLISAPGNNNGDDSTQSDTRTYINGNYIPAITRAAITSGQK